MSSSYRIELDNWLRNLDVNTFSVLDVGGSQLPIKGRTKTWNVKKYVITDLDEPHVNSPKPDIAFDLENDVWSDMWDDPKQFSMVFCLEVFDYLVRPDQALMNIYDMLQDDGEAWVSFPFLYPTHQPVEAEGLRYTENSIYRLAIMAGLNVDEVIRRRPETNAVQQLWSLERMRYAKNYDHNVTGWIVRLSK